MDKRTATTTRKLASVAGYITLWSAQALLIRGSVRPIDPSDPTSPVAYPYEVMGVTLAVELFKLVLALGIVLFTNTESSGDAYFKARMLYRRFPDGLWFMIPAAIYTLYNGLAFVNLRLLQPATYRLLINVRILFSGLLLQTFFGTYLSRRQWIALAILLLACVIEQMGAFQLDTGLFPLITMSMQGLCSSLGGVYFQWLLQKQGDGEPLGLWSKNLYLYFWSVLANILAILIFRAELASPSALFANFDVGVAPIVLAAGLGGVFTSFLLRDLDVIIKEYANFGEMVIVAIAQSYLFGAELRLALFLAILVVSYSLHMYQTPNDLHPEPKTHKVQDVELSDMDEDAAGLLECAASS
ncbi:EamA domain-containing protein [Plasmodiophora brassicae]